MAHKLMAVFQNAHSNGQMGYAAKPVDKDEDAGKAPSMQQLITFFQEHPNPKDEEEFHKWCEENGINPHKAEELVYRMTTKYVKFLTGGKSVKDKKTAADVNADELAMGIEVEMEHTSDKDTAKRIALDHLTELGSYYTHLKKMEEQAKKGG